MAKPELILHIGKGKSGSSSLQKAFDDSAEIFRSGGIYCPRAPKKRFGSALYFCLESELVRGAILGETPVNLQNKTDSLVKEAIRQFKKSNCKKMLISEERLSTIPNLYKFIDVVQEKAVSNDGKKDLFRRFQRYEDSYINKLNRLKQLFNDFDVKIVCYLRRQDLFIESGYNQLHKTIHRRQKYYDSLRECRGYQKLILNSMEEKSSRLLSPYMDIDYFHDFYLYNFKNTCDYKKLCLWADVFGKENIIVKPFEKGQFRRGLVKDFFVDILNVSEDKLTKLKELYVNEKISHDLLEYLIKYEPPRECYNKEDLYNITRKLNNANNFQQYFTLRERIQLMDFHNEGNEKIAREFLGREDGVLFYEEIGTKEEKYPGLSDETKLFLDREFKQLLSSRKRHVTALKQIVLRWIRRA